jgi:hypothetical protein
LTKIRGVDQTIRQQDEGVATSLSDLAGEFVGFAVVHLDLEQRLRRSLILAKIAWNIRRS